MFDVRLRLHTATGEKGRVLPTSTLTASIQESGIAVLEFAVSEIVAGRLGLQTLVAVEYSTGGPFQQPRNGLFIATRDEGDAADASKTVAFKAVPFVPWLLEGMHQRMVPYPGAKYLPTKHEWNNVTPGHILWTLMEHGQRVDNWAPLLRMDFSSTKDSAGVAWTNAERWSPEFERLTSIRAIFDAHVNNGLIDWWTEGTKLRVFRPGTGTMLPNVKLGGPGFTRMPSQRAYEGQFNYLTIIATDGARYYSNPGADTTFGVRHMTATLSGVKLADADKIVQPMLLEGRTPQQELSYEWEPAGDMPVPWRDFQVGDGVKVRGRDGWLEQRVLGVTVRKDSTGIQVRATVGSKLLNRLARAVRKMEGGSLGDLQGGTGVVLPVAPPPPAAEPTAPGAIRVSKSTATWGEDGKAQTAVSFAWDEVTQTVSGADVDGITYEVWTRTAESAPARATETDALTFTVEGWEPGVARYVKVRARDRTGRLSAFSPEVAVTPDTPASIVPKVPTGLRQTSNTGAFQQDGTSLATVAVAWEPVTHSLDDVVVSISEYEVTAGLEVRRVREPSATLTVPTGKIVAVTVRALTTLDVWGDPSTPLNVTGAAPAASTVSPSAPILTAGMGGVAYRFDGLSSTGAAMPVGFARIVVDTGASATGPWVSEGVTLSDAGGGTVAAAVGNTVHVRFRAFDTLGRAMGTSVVKSAVASGVPLDAIPGLEVDLDGIRHTADGKNRVYVQTNSPGESLFPNGSFEKASGTVEVRRNLIKTPVLSSATTGWDRPNSAQFSWSPVSGLGLRLFSSVPVSSLYVIRYKADAFAGTVRSASLRIRNDEASARTYWLDMVWRNAGNATLKTDSGAQVSLPAGGEGNLEIVNKVAPAEAVSVDLCLRLSAGPAADVVVLDNSSMLEVGAAVGVPFSPEITFPDRDLTPSWVGAANESESILSGTMPQDLNGAAYTGGRGFQSSDWASSGSKSLRITAWGTGSASNAAVAKSGLFAAGQTYTIFAKARLVAPLTGTDERYARRIRLLGSGNLLSPQVPNEAGVHDIRWVVTPATGATTIQLWHGGLPGSPDIWWDDLTVFAGDVEKSFTQGDLWLQLDADGTSVVAVKVWNGATWAPQVLHADSVIAANSITAPLIKAGEIQVNHVSPSFGDTLDLQGNGSINLIAGQVDANAAALNDQQVILDTQGSQIAAAQAAAEAAANGASEAGIAAAAASAAAAAAQAGVDNLSLALTLTSTDLRLSRPGDPVALHMANGNISIRRNGVAQTWWDEQQMIVPKLKTSQVVVGQTVITEGASRTTWQRL